MAGNKNLGMRIENYGMIHMKKTYKSGDIIQIEFPHTEYYMLVIFANKATLINAKGERWSTPMTAIKYTLTHEELVELIEDEGEYSHASFWFKPKKDGGAGWSWKYIPNAKFGVVLEG